MTDEQVQENVVDEVVTQEQVPNHVEDSEKHNLSQETEEEAYQDRNWRQARQRMKEQENMIKAQQELLEKYSKQAAPPPIPDELDSLDESEYLTAGKTRKFIEREAQRQAKQIVEQTLAEREKSRFAEKLRSKFSDFDDVVSSESLALLEEEEPELAEAISKLNDPYSQGLQCYKLLKNSPLLDKLPNRRRKKEVEKKLEENKNKLPSPSAYENRPMAQAFTMGDDPSKLYEEMKKYASMAPGI